MTMNLVLQGTCATLPELRRIAALAQPARVFELSAHALRCEQVDDSPGIRDAVALSAASASIDATFIGAARGLADFRLVAMDMDSTLITIECIDEIADMQGLKREVSEITEAAMRGELEFAESLTRRVALLKGLDASALQRVYDERLRISVGGEAMLAAARAAGLKTLLVSGGFTYFAERLRDRLGLDYTHANTLEIDGGKLTGRIIGGIIDSQKKMRAVKQVCAAMGIGPEQAIVIGDGANDLKMMGIAGLSVAFHAKPMVRAQADVALNFTGLDGLIAILA